MTKRLIILGSTGSVGQNALDVIAAGADAWQVVGLAAGSDAQTLCEQANRFRPEAIALSRPGENCPWQPNLHYAPRIYTGPDALWTLVDEVHADSVLSAVVGTAGLSATLRAIELGRRIALANKEALVIAGSVLMPLAARTGASIIPVDSEHSAIFQALHAGKAGEVRKVYLTASGGPFRTFSVEAMEHVTVEDAMRHPTWRMGPKISIDSATMMNKALEIVEAGWLFGLRPEQIEVVIHPESVIHSMVEFCDGSLIAQLSAPDMRTPIQYALTYPSRRLGPAARLDLTRPCQWNLHPPDSHRFPALKLGYDAARRGGTCGAVLNAANEAAVELFRTGLIRYRDIARLTRDLLQRHQPVSDPTLDEVLSADRWARDEVCRCTTGLRK